MKNMLVKVNLLALSFLLLFVGYAFSMPKHGDEFEITHGSGVYGTIAGGPSEWIGEYNLLFNMYDPSIPDYIGFCLERDEFLSTGSLSPLDPYSVDTVKNYATEGGVAGASDQGGGIMGDPLSDATKWVYWEYAFDDQFGSAIAADLLARYVQETIWYLEEEMGMVDMSTEALSFYTTYVSGQDNISLTSGYNIKALNYDEQWNYGDGDEWYPAQSMIIGEPVPEPATMLLFGAGLIGLAGFARRRNKK